MDPRDMDPVEPLEELVRIDSVNPSMGGAWRRARTPRRRCRRSTPCSTAFASNLSRSGGIPCVVLGPGSIDQAHTDDGWVSLDEARKAAAIYAQTARRLAEHDAEGGR